VEPGGADDGLVGPPDYRERRREPLGPRREGVFHVTAHRGLVLRHQDPPVQRGILGRRLEQPGHVARAERLQPDVISFERLC
jgi:hypothetical protein